MDLRRDFPERDWFPVSGDNSQIFKQFSDSFARERDNSRKLFFEGNPSDWTHSGLGTVPFARSPNSFFATETGRESPSRARFGASPRAEGIPIPIKVVHEKSNQAKDKETEEEMGEDGVDSETSSLGSSLSHRSGESCETNLSNGGSYRSSGSSASSRSRKAHEAKVQPRIHHIPITVEPREGRETSSGYGSEETKPRNGVETLSRSSSSSSSATSCGDRRARSPAHSLGSESASSRVESPQTHVHQIPVQVETQPLPNLREIPKAKTRTPTPGLGQSTGRSKDQAQASSSATTGPFVTRIPVAGETDGSLYSEHGGDQATPSPEPAPKRDPMDLIDEINAEIDSIEKSVHTFRGQFQDKEYRFLDEMLTRLMIRLDNVEANGCDAVRKARKASVNKVHKVVALLEATAKGTATETQKEISSASGLSEGTASSEITLNQTRCSENVPEPMEAQSVTPLPDLEESSYNDVERPAEDSVRPAKSTLNIIKKSSS